MQRVVSFIVSILIIIIHLVIGMENVIKSNTKDMREIVTILERNIRDKNKEIEKIRTQNNQLSLRNVKLDNDISALKMKNTEELKLKKALQIEKKESEKLKTQLVALKMSNEVLRRKVGEFDNDRKELDNKIKKNEEEIDYINDLNKALEKAYKSLQRKYQRKNDELERLTREGRI